MAKTRQAILTSSLRARSFAKVNIALLTYVWMKANTDNITIYRKTIDDPDIIFLYKIWYQKNIRTQRNVQWRLILMQFRTLCCSFALGLHSGLFSDAKKCNYLKCSLFSHPQNFSEQSHNFWSKIELCARLPSFLGFSCISIFQQNCIPRNTRKRNKYYLLK